MFVLVKLPGTVKEGKKRRKFVHFSESFAVFKLFFLLELKLTVNKQPREEMRTDGDVIPMVCGRLSSCHHSFLVLKKKKNNKTKR